MSLSLLLLPFLCAGFQDDKKTEARLHLHELASAVALFERYTGRSPAELADLKTQPAYVDFWPPDGFLAGDLPRDPWGAEYRIKGRAVVCSREGLKARLPPRRRSPVVPPNPRLKRFFTARIQIQTLAARVRAYLEVRGALPGENLFEELPEDPWGNEIKYVREFDYAIVRVREPGSRRVRISAGEKAKLKEGSATVMSEEEKTRISKRLDESIGDDLRLRREAAVELIHMGASAGMIRRRISVTDDPVSRKLLEDLAGRMPSDEPSWVREDRPLIEVVSTSSLRQLRANERNASFAMKMIATAQKDFSANDRDGNGVRDYWVADIRGLHTVNNIRAIGMPIARADAFPRKLSPVLRGNPSTSAKAGFMYCVIPKFEDEKGKILKYDDGKGLNPDGFGAAAFPKTYTVGGRWTFIISEDSLLYYKDTGGEPPEVFPNDPAAEGWKKY